MLEIAFTNVNHIPLLNTLDNFLVCSSEKEREQAGVWDCCSCVWVYLTNLRAAEGDSHPHYNPFYNPIKHDRPLLPAAAALAPTIWPQFHLRWACPSEAQGGELEAQWHILSKKYADMSKAKERAVLKAKDLKVRTDSLAAELEKEKQASSSSLTMARRACRENLAIKRAIQSLGCKVQFSTDGGHVLESGGTRENSSYSLRRDLHAASGQSNEGADLSVSIVAMDDNTDDNMVHVNTLSRVCDTFCPFRTGEGCKWPDGGCPQLGSQFVGLKANFDAFDRLSIYDHYFGSE